jgi:hypothetical protein
MCASNDSAADRDKAGSQCDLHERQERTDFFPVPLVPPAEASDQHRVFYADAVGVRGRCHRQRSHQRQQIPGREGDAIEREERSEVAGMAHEPIGPLRSKVPLVSTSRVRV